MSLWDIKGILNGRPLTLNSGSSIDSEFLTTNYLLLRLHLNLPPDYRVVYLK